MKLSKVLLFFALVTLFGACNNKPSQPKMPTLEKVTATSETMNNIQMVRWNLADYSYKGVDKAAGGTKAPYLILRDGKASGFAGCNNFVGKYEEGTNNTIRFIDIKVPQRTCKDFSLQEASYTALLNTATAYEVSETGKKMTIKCLQGELRFSTNN